MAKRGLGMGLDALLATSSVARDKQQLEQKSGTTEVNNSDELSTISVADIKPGKYQPRKEISSEALEELSTSIKSQGIIQPIILRVLEDGTYEIIAGERRWRAAKQAGLTEVPCIVKQVPDKAAVAMALIENIQREDLNSIEEAQALEQLQDEFRLTHQQIADVIGKSRTTVTNLLRLNQLNSEVKELVLVNKLEMGHARALLSLDEHQQYEIAEQIVNKKLTVRQSEQLVKKVLEPKKEPVKANPTDQALSWSKLLEDKIKADVNIDISAKGKAKITINISDSELENVLEKLANG